MQDLKDLKKCFLRVRSRGTGPRATVVKAVSVYRRARDRPSPCLDWNGKQSWPVDDFRTDRTLAGDRPPRYGPGRGSLRYASVREQVLPNYGLLKVF